MGRKRKRQESNLPKTPARPPTGLKPARPTGSGTLPGRRIAGLSGIVNTPSRAYFGKPPVGFPFGRSVDVRAGSLFAPVRPPACELLLLRAHGRLCRCSAEKRPCCGASTGCPRRGRGG